MIPVIYPNYYPHQTNYNKRNNVVTIVTTKVGTFSSTWKGSGTLYFDPGDGGPIEPLVLTTDGVNWDHEYLSADSKTIIITGDILGVTYISAGSNAIADIEIDKFVSINIIALSINDLTFDCSILKNLDLSYIKLKNNSLTFSYSVFKVWTGSTFNFQSCFSSSSDVANAIISLANSGMHDCSLLLDGSNPAPPSTQEVIDGISTLAGNGVTLYVST